MSLQQQNNSQPVEICGLSKFHITLSSGNPQDHIYANGRMQCGVFITIHAFDCAHNGITLSGEQLDNIKLINYSTGKTLSNGWSYSSDKNSYHHTFPYAKNSQVSDLSYEEITNNKSNTEISYQSKIYWVTTTKIEAIKIGALVTFNGKTYTTTGVDTSSFNSYASVTTHEALIYHTADLIGTGVEEIASGSYIVHEKIDNRTWDTTHTSEKDVNYPWTQSNWYITTKKGFAVHDVSIWNTMEDKDRRNKKFHGFSHLTHSSSIFGFGAADLYLWFIWGLDVEDRAAGTDYATTSYSVSRGLGRADKYTYTTDPIVQLHTTTRKDAISISKLYLKSPVKNLWTDKQSNKPSFQFRDVYGNESGVIQIEMDNYNQFHFKDM
ncbi:hypothetical protein M5U04_11265 [Xenorhabdus sp. XENO-1]|uniref:hypothetical protein n=1 Tax=Xenorhabdus bovienii TaxID=40576 RepID=UPI0020CA7399|nr:hypothetical protein [Xenorhabdus bovienii]MCP9268658.1 hypothetical protein [Xenorhabdus bovienii subsp. africana]